MNRIGFSWLNMCWSNSMRNMINLFVYSGLLNVILFCLLLFLFFVVAKWNKMENTNSQCVSSQMHAVYELMHNFYCCLCWIWIHYAVINTYLTLSRLPIAVLWMNFKCVFNFVEPQSVQSINSISSYVLCTVYFEYIHTWTRMLPHTFPLQGVKKKLQ